MFNKYIFIFLGVLSINMLVSGMEKELVPSKIKTLKELEEKIKENDTKSDVEQGISEQFNFDISPKAFCEYAQENIPGPENELLYLALKRVSETEHDCYEQLKKLLINTRKARMHNSESADESKLDALLNSYNIAAKEIKYNTLLNKFQDTKSQLGWTRSVLLSCWGLSTGLFVILMLKLTNG